MIESRAEKIMESLDTEFKLRANELENRRLVRHIRGFTFQHDERENIIYYAKDLFEKIEDDKIDYYIEILFDLLIKYELNCKDEMLRLLQSRTTSNKRDAQKEKNMLKGVDDILDYLGGVVVKNEKSSQLRMMLFELKSNPHSFKGGVQNNSYTKQDLKSDLRYYFKGETDAINDLVNSLSSDFIIKK